VSAYFTNPSRPVLAAPTVAALRSEPSALLSAGMLAIFSTIGAGALFTKGVYFDPLSVDADDGATVFKPDDIGGGAAGRWKTHPGLSGSAGGSDFSAPVARVNWATGNDPVPAVLCGFSVDRGAVAGVERDRAAILWDETTGTMNVAFSSTDDTALTSTFIPLVAGSFATKAGSASIAGAIRLYQNETITAKIGANTWDLAVGTNLGDAAFGSADWTTASLNANGDVTVTSRVGNVYARGGHFYVYDTSGVTQLLDASVGGGYLNVAGRVRAYNGATLVFDADVTSAVVQANAALRAYDPTGTTKYFDASSTEVLALKAGVGTGTTVGLALRNTTAAAGTVQRSPTFVREGHALVAGVDSTYLWEEQFIPVSNSAARFLARRSSNNGAAWSTSWEFTTSTPLQFVEALIVPGAFACSSGGGYFFDGDYSGMFRGGSGDLQLIARAATMAMLLRSPTTSAGVASFRLYASGGTRGADEDLVEYGDVAAGFTRRAGIRGDGTYAGPAWRDGGAQVANYTTKAREVVLLDPSGGAFDFTLPDATTCARQQIKAICTAVSANVVTLKTTGGQTINGSASGALTLGNAGTLESGLFTSDGTNWRFERIAT